MTVEELGKARGWEAVCLPRPGAEARGLPVCCDRLGLAVTHVPEGAVWMTLTGHLNTVAAATLNRAAAVVLCGGQHWPGEAVEAAREHGVNLFQSPLPSFEAACPPVLRAAEKTAGERETAR